ncbi:MAG TPA: FAD-binding protein [Myxococcales bacterium]|nr:FAD-binding protein [Myxococcales bacterium]
MSSAGVPAEVEVLVVGGGMAGAMAALSAARAGARVLVARRALGATAISSGAVDVAPGPGAPLSDLPAQRVPPEQAAAAVARLHPAHPYAVLSARLNRLGESLRFCAQALPELFDAPPERNVLLPTPLGTLKPAAMAQRAQVAADAAGLPERVVVVQLQALPSCDARLVAVGLEEAGRALGRKIGAVEITSTFFRTVDDPHRPVHELAAMLDAEGAVEALAAELKPRLPEGTQAVLFPPVLGRARLDAAARLSAALGMPCAELLSAAPSVPGVRLQEALDRALKRAGVEVVEAAAECRDLQAGSYALGERGVTARAAVLASGKFLGGGIERAGRFRETVFGLPVFAGARLVGGEYVGDLLGERVESDQVAFHAGVRIDGSLRPLRADGAPASPSLFAAGSVIRGYDPASDKTGLGVAIFTGFLAGEEAAAAARAPPGT